MIIKDQDRLNHVCMESVGRLYGNPVVTLRAVIGAREVMVYDRDCTPIGLILIISLRRIGNSPYDIYQLIINNAREETPTRLSVNSCQRVCQ